MFVFTVNNFFCLILLLYLRESVHKSLKFLIAGVGVLFGLLERLTVRSL